MRCLLLLLFLSAIRPLWAAPEPLFDGKSFAGWEGDTTRTWRIEEGALTAGSVAVKQEHNDFLTTAEEFGDFELRLQYRLAGTEGFVNGGVQFRSQRVPDNFEVSGYQADLGMGYDGALYDESRRNKVLARPEEAVLKQALKPGGWNDYRIRAEGPRIRLWLNDVLTVDYTETDPDIPQRGRIALQIHGNAQSQVWYRRLVIEKLEPARTVGPVQRRFAEDEEETPPRVAFADGKFEMRDGEVIVFTGGENMVRLVADGGLEEALTRAAGARWVKFRSMAWEGDTVYEQWRDLNFGTWREQLEAAGATCVVTWFGQMEALDVAHDDAAFARACAALLDEFRAVTPRLVVLLPMEFDNHPWPDPLPGLPDNTPANPRLLRLAAIMKTLAAERGAVVLDVPKLERKWQGEDRAERTADGIHLTSRAIRYDFVPLLTDGLGVALQTSGNREPLASLIREKNQLWQDCWRTMNWAFAYSDRTTQPFAQGSNGHPGLVAELEQYRPLIRQADARIQAAVRGEPVPPHSLPAPEVLPAPEPPAVEQASFTVREGFSVNLFASEADGLVKPLQIRWDARGRLWAACAPGYPQLVPGAPRNDYLLVCEDTDGDGRADKFFRFAEGLTMPMGMEFADGGVYVCESTQLVFFAGADGDGPATEKQVILSGFGTGDSHQMINSLRRGPDGYLWFSQGLHIFSRIETPRGIVRFDRAGLWRFHPRTRDLQGFFGGAAAGANCWGVTFADNGQVFHCAADNVQGFYTTPGLGAWANPAQYAQIGALAVSPVKGMSLEYLQGSHLPPELQGALLKPVYFNNEVLLWRLVEDGSGYRTEELGPLLRSSQAAFRPVNAQVGPDGAIYVCDWCNPVIGHYQASYRDPARDKVHGRVWRVTANGRPLTSPQPVTGLDAAALLAALRSPERFVRDQARNRLIDLPEAREAVIAEALRDPADAGFLHMALGVLAGSGKPLPAAVAEASLTSADAGLRAFAVRVVSRTGMDSAELSGIGWLRRAVRDADARVRLEAVIAASYAGTAEAMEIACESLDAGHDRFLDYALENTVLALQPQWGPALDRGTLAFGGNAAHLAWVLEHSGRGQSLSAALQKALTNSGLTDDARDRLRCLLIAGGNADDLTAAVHAGPWTGGVMKSLTDAALRKVRPSGDFSAALEAAWSASTDGNPDAAVLGTAWGLPGWQERLTGWIRQRTGAERVATMENLARAAGLGAVPFLTECSAAGDPAALRVLACLDARAAAPGAAAAWSGNAAVDAGLVEAFLGQDGGPDLLAAALESVPPPAEAARAVLAILAAQGRTDGTLTTRLRTAAGLPATEPVPAWSEVVVAEWVAAAAASGDATRGAAVFQRPALACTGCHAVNGAGGTAGPDLSGIGRGMTPGLITESVFWPGRQIKEGYFLTTATTTDGRVHSGFRSAETPQTLTLRLPGTVATETLEKSAIRERTDNGSLMPEGIVSQLSRQERLDLLRYLFATGKP